MKNIIRQRTTYLYKQKNVRKYKITHRGLSKIISLKPRTQELLLDILELIGSSNNLDAITIEISFRDLGFKNFANFSKYRNELIHERLLFYKDNLHFINPCYINYLSRRQQGYLFNLFKLKKTSKVTMTDPVLKIVSA